MLSGDFAFVLYDSKSKAFLAARDPIGVCPLYIGWGRDGSVWFASEMKALVEDCTTYQTFPPGHYYTSKGNKFVRWYNPPWWSEELVPTGDLEPSLQAIRARLEEAVVKRMMGDVPYGVLLSGGLDSSLVASIACRHVGERGRLRSFAIGLRGAPDLAFARQVADFLGTVHHEFYFTVQEGLDALRQIIWHLETYDVTTIRASTPMYLLARKIKALGVKMVLSGEGSDEVFGGYLYFHRAPSQEDFHRETVRRVKNLHVSDCLRANKSTAAWGLEVRVPFLDKDFLDAAFAVHPRYKVCGPERMEKWLLRTAFDTPDRPYLPQSILWRQKEQFSDGVGYSWISSLKEYAEREIPDDLFARRAELYPEDMPATKEAFMYRQIFEEVRHRRCPAVSLLWCGGVVF
jgi:asparagine synthase (glutamine-hydrolysing)